MLISELAFLPVEKFKQEFEKYKNNDKYIIKEAGLNVLGHAIHSLNKDVVEYLLSQHSYDLNSELDQTVRNISLKKILPYLHIIELYPEDKSQENIDILNLVKNHGAKIELIDTKELNSLGQGIHLLRSTLKEPLCSYLLDNQLFNNRYFSAKLNAYLMHSLAVGINNKELLLEDEKKLGYLLSHENFKIHVSNLQDMLSYLSYETKNDNKELYNNFFNHVKESFLESSNLSHETIAQQILLLKIQEDSFSIMDLDRVLTLLKKINPDRDNVLPVNQETINTVIQKLNIPVYIKLKELFPELKNDELCISTISKIKDEPFEKINSKFFYKRIYLPMFNILEHFKDVNTEDMKNYKTSWFNHYLSAIEDRKISTIYQEKQKINFFHNDISVENNAVINNLNLKIDDSIFDRPITFMNDKHFRYYFQPKENTSKSLLLINIFNNKLSLTEIEQSIQKIKGNEMFNLEETLSHYIDNKHKGELSFLYEEASSFEKIALLKKSAIPEPAFFDTIKVLQNCIMNDDADFIQYSLNKIKNPQKGIDEKFLDNFLSYIQEGISGFLKKDILFTSNTLDDVFSIIATPTGVDLLLNEKFKNNLNDFYQKTLVKDKEHDKNGNDSEQITHYINNIKNIEDRWVLLEKKVITDIFDKTPNLTSVNKRSIL